MTGDANVMPTLWQQRPRTPWQEGEMARYIRCECGFVAHGDTDDLVVAAIREHLRADHPDLMDSVGDQDLLGWIHLE
jgi:predicted small metal-binding protein